MREEAARALLRTRAKCTFASVEDLAERVPELRKNELVTLAEVGALNALGANAKLKTGNLKLPFHRRDALWQVERATRRRGPLLEGVVEQDMPSPLARMDDRERLLADFRGTGLTVGPHPMAYKRAQLDRQGVRRASELAHLRDGQRVRVGGAVIARQRPGTAHGFVFLSLED